MAWNMNTHQSILNQKQKRKPPEAVEGRDKRGEEEHSETDPAQTPAAGQAGRHPDLAVGGHADCVRMRICVAVVLPDGRTISVNNLKEVMRMNEIATIRSDSEFKKFLDELQDRADLENLKSYTSRRRQLIDSICALDPDDKFSVRQLREIFDLAK